MNHEIPIDERNRRCLNIWFFIAAYTLVGCVPAGTGTLGNARFPEASTAGFQPEREYNVSYENMWKRIRHVLNAERISIASSDKKEGRIRTDYIQGETQLLLGGFADAFSTRYKYTISLERIAQDKTRLNIICALETAPDTGHWADASKDNAALVTNLENWLYERIHKSS